MVLDLSDLEPDGCQIRDLPAPSCNNGEDEMGYTMRKKHQHPRTTEDDELVRNKKAKKNNLETEADSSSSSDHSCFVALVTVSNLHKDALDLPKDFTSLNLLEKECRKIVLRDRWERSWAMDLAFNKSSDTFYIRKGWRSFCDENGKEAGSSFVFKLVGNRETPLLSICSTESISNKKNKESCIEHSTTPIKSRFVTLTIEHQSFRRGSLSLPLRFMKKHGLDKPRLITLLGRDGTKWVANLRRENTGGRMRLGKGWKDFSLANGLKVGDSFTLELVLKDNNNTPMFCLMQRGEHCSKASNKESVSTNPNSGNKKRKAKNNSKELVGNKCIPNRNDSLSPNRTLLLSTKSTSSIRQQGECSEGREKQRFPTQPSCGNKTKEGKNIIEERRDSSSAIKNQLVTLTLTPEDVRACQLILPSQFMKANGIFKLGKITLLGKNGTRWLAFLLSKDGLLSLGCGWKDFCQANGVKTGDSFTLECICEQDTTHVFKFCSNS